MAIAARVSAGFYQRCRHKQDIVLHLEHKAARNCSLIGPEPLSRSTIRPARGTNAEKPAGKITAAARHHARMAEDDHVEEVRTHESHSRCAETLACA
jgi:hypothetical protein